MAYITGDKASIALSGTGAPTQADAFNFFLRYSRDKRLACPYGSAVDTYVNTRPSGEGYVDVMIDSAASTPPVLVPANTIWTVVHTTVTGQTESFTVLCTDRVSGSNNHTKATQVVRYVFVLNSDITLG